MDNMTNYDKLRALQAKLDNLSSVSAPEQFNSLGNLFTEDCITFVYSMREYDEPSIGREATVEKYKKILKFCHIYERRILSHSTAPDGKTVYCEMKNCVHIFDEFLDPFYETVVAVFDDEGLIKELRQYSCRSHIVEIIQAKTGEGPYADIPTSRGKKIENVPCCKWAWALAMCVCISGESIAGVIIRKQGHYKRDLSPLWVQDWLSLNRAKTEPTNCFGPVCDQLDCCDSSHWLIKGVGFE